MSKLHSFASLSAARKRRQELIRLNYSCFEIFLGQGDNEGRWCFWVN